MASSEGATYSITGEGITNSIAGSGVAKVTAGAGGAKSGSEVESSPLEWQHRPWCVGVSCQPSGATWSQP